MANMVAIYKHFKNIRKNKLNAFFKELQEQIDLDKIDLMSAGSDSDLETLKQFVKDEYGVVIKRNYNKEEIIIEGVKEVKDNVTVQKEIMDNLIRSTVEYKGEALKIMTEIKEYSPHTTQMVISTLVAVSERLNVINIGEKGHSKTYCTKQLLQQLEIPFNEIKGHLTPKRFYEMLKLYNGTLILIDESANMLTDLEIRNLLLSALNKERVWWLDDYFDMTSAIIFNSNYIQNNPIMRAVMDRCITNRIVLTQEQLKEKLQSSRTYTPNKEVWQQVKNNIFRKTELNQHEIDVVYKVLMLSQVESLRDKWRFMNIAKTSIKVLDNLAFLKYFAKIDTVDLISEMDISRSDKVKLIAQATNKSIRTAQRELKGRGR